MALVFKTSYPTFADLPTLGNTDGDLRYVADTGLCYRWNVDTTAWVAYTTVPALVTTDGIGLVGALRGTVLDVPAPSAIDAAAITSGTLSTARLDTGTTAGKVVVLNGSAQLPAVSAALLTNVPAPSSIDASTITSGTLPTARLDSGTSAGQVVVLNGSAQLPAVSAALLTNVPAPAAIDASTITSGTLPTARLDSGTSAGQVVVLNGSAQLPAVSAANLTNIPAPTSGVMLTKEFTYDFSVQGGTVGNKTLSGGSLPSSIVITRVTAVGLTNLVGGSGGYTFSTNSGTTTFNPIAATNSDINSVAFDVRQSFDTPIKNATGNPVLMTIAGSAVTAGKFRLLIEYYPYTA